MIIAVPPPPTYKNVYQFTCTEQKVSDNSDVHRSLQNCAPSVRNMLHVSLLAPKIWRFLLDLLKTCVPLAQGYAITLCASSLAACKPHEAAVHHLGYGMTTDLTLTLTTQFCTYSA
jgi:hypothetical protein